MLTKETTLKAILRVRLFMVIACILSGWLAGVNIERYLVRMPAWKKMNILTWAEYSRHEYFGNGFYLHLFEAGCCFLLLLFSSYLVMKNKLRFLAPLVYTATLLIAAALVLTVFTTNAMFRLPEIGNNPALIQETFNEFHYWGAYRGAAQILAFCACVWAMGRCYVIKYVRV